MLQALLKLVLDSEELDSVEPSPVQTPMPSVLPMPSVVVLNTMLDSRPDLPLDVLP